MNERIQIIALAVSAVLLLSVLELVRRKKLTEEYSFLWIASAFALLGLAWRRDLLDKTALWLGVYYPPALLVLFLVLVVFVGLLSLSVILSRQQRQLERLIEDTAILYAEMRDMRSSDRAESQEPEPYRPAK